MTNYPSSLTDNQWNLIESFLPKLKSGGYERKHSRREMLNAIFYINKTGCQWRYLPSDFAPWKSVYSYFRRLCAKKIFEKINSHLNIRMRLKEGETQSHRCFVLIPKVSMVMLILIKKEQMEIKKLKVAKDILLLMSLDLYFFV